MRATRRTLSVRRSAALVRLAMRLRALGVT
jgi:hypothetical protein